MTALVLMLVALVSLFVLWRFELLPIGRGRGQPDVAVALRDLLLAKASGKLTAEEFARQEAALHASLLTAPSGGGNAATKYLWLIPVACMVAAGGVYLAGDRAGSTASVASLPPEPPLLGTGASDPKVQANSGGDLNTMVKRLAEKMEKDPNNGEGWLLLARTYGELHKPGEAAKAYARAAALLPPDANLLADWADAHVVAHDRKWDDEARAIVKRALAADPKHLKSLALAGSEAFDRADYKGAIALWKRMQAVAPADSMDAKLAEANIQEATAMLGGKPAPVKEAAAAVPAGGIAGTISLDPKLKGQVAAGDAVFVVAKTPDGNGPPVAAKRYTVADLPVKFTLDDADAMMPNRKLSQFGEVLVTARISRSGDAVPQPGDAASVPLKAKIGATGLKLDISAGKR